MDEESWRTLLSTWSEEIMRYEDEAALQALPAEVHASRWLGYPGATEAQLAAAEARLGCALPPSYRTFLSLTNGWRLPTQFIHEVWSTEQIEWLPHASPEFIPAWIDGANRATEQYGPPDAISDDEYLVYGNEQNPHIMRDDYLQTALQISEWGYHGNGVYLLNPQTVTTDGEWEAWFFAAWIPGAKRYRSFWDLMRSEREKFLYLAQH